MKHPTSKSKSAEGISSFSSMEPINKNKINIFPNYWELGSGIRTYNLRRIETSSRYHVNIQSTKKIERKWRLGFH
jgi:hypothetical protein